MIAPKSTILRSEVKVLVSQSNVSIQKCDSCIQRNRELQKVPLKISPVSEKNEVKVHQICPKASGLK